MVGGNGVGGSGRYGDFFGGAGVQGIERVQGIARVQGIYWVRGIEWVRGIPKAAENLGAGITTWVRGLPQGCGE